MITLRVLDTTGDTEYQVKSVAEAQQYIPKESWIFDSSTGELLGSIDEMREGRSYYVTPKVRGGE